MRRANMPSLVTGAFAASFVAALGTANLGGRMFWPLVSDKFAKMTVSFNSGKI